MSPCTYYTYVQKKHGPNCEGCKEENAKYKRTKKASNRAIAEAQVNEIGVACLAALNDNITCGALSTYEWYCCRGAACKAAKQEQYLIREALYIRSA